MATARINHGTNWYLSIIPRINTSTHNVYTLSVTTMAYYIPNVLELKTTNFPKSLMPTLTVSMATLTLIAQ